MYNILLVCSAGMSTSLLVTKMQAAAEKKNIDAKIQATAEADLDAHVDGVDILLLGPQVRYLQSKMKAKFAEKGVPVEVINSVDYGMMNGEKVLDAAIKKIRG